MPVPEIDSAAGFRAAIVTATNDAVQRRLRRLVFVDPDFADWPLDDAALLDALTAFVRLPGRELVLLARQFDDVRRRQAKFAAWRRIWSHAVAAWKPADEELSLPCLLIADRVRSVELIDRLHWRGRVMADDPRIQRLGDEIDVFLQRCEPTFGATTLGL